MDTYTPYRYSHRVPLPSDPDRERIVSTATATYTIVGMTCSHCVAAVTGELEAVAGVERVAVSLEGATAVVTGDVSADEVAAAVDRAGYTATPCP